ncbi:MAG TPA: TIM barrel protein [Lichenihabitans sp.]|jgi:xylose isomerase|nr:TIM barrel protein [Lichenihabitans sp.]
MRYATRLNAFASRPELFEGHGPGDRLGTADQVRRAATVRGLGALDLNFPDHLAGPGGAGIVRRAADLGLALNGFAMRYYGDPAFKAGAFTHPDRAVRRRAIDLTKRGIDALAEAGGTLMTLWLGQDGFDYPFQCDYAALWALEVDGIREVAMHNSAVDVSIEYKPNEPRAFSLLRDVGTTLLAVAEAACPNLGVTLDFAHVLYAGEQPAFAAALVARKSRLLGVHLNDGYGGRDDGLMAGSVHPVQTLELLRQIARDGYAGAIYFDTFPDASGLDPVAECEGNIAAVEALRAEAARLDRDNRLIEALERQDPVTGQAVLRDARRSA